MKKGSRFAKVLVMVIVSSIISTIVVDLFDKRALLTTEENLATHFEEFKNEGAYDVKVVMKRKIGNRYVLLYALNGQEKRVGIAYYIKKNVLPLYELVRDEEAKNASVGSSFFTNEQFIVYGKQIAAKSFTYRSDLEFKEVRLPNEPYFIHVESYHGQLAVPLLSFNDDHGKVITTVPAK
ncbi:hypothetical protein LCM10_02315 [Rossellomorea aquimaris]|uniref:hypothetical protein n=1 Tax=Rossellomorea aquimaris TaxID=189382 RepID=UPI001CD66553|nr:hypothetical protein [Rossellomorea aquimaris]MCA1053806.1 hypothetical protein [Rossellomorea aquimaris]